MNVLKYFQTAMPKVPEEWLDHMRSVSPPVPDELNPETREKRKLADERSQALREKGETAANKFESSLHELELLLTQRKNKDDTEIVTG